MTTTLTSPRIERPLTGQQQGWDPGASVCALVAVAGLLAEYAFFEPLVAVSWCQLVQALTVAAFCALQAARQRDAGVAGLVRRYWLDLAVLPAAAIAASLSGAAVVATVVHAAAVYLVIRQVAQVGRVVLTRAAECAAGSRSGPIRLMVGTYLALIIVGGLLLAMPKATTADHRNSPNTHLLNSAFAASSAVCTVGLNVYDMPRDYTLFGQMVILGLIQAGGLLMLVFGTLFGLLLVRRLTGETDGLGWTDPQRIGRVIRAIVVTVFAIEGVGAILLYSAWGDEGTVGARVFHAVFQAIGAFCNAGFALQKESLVGQGGLWQVYGVILPLSVLGGLGLPVLYEIGRRLRSGSENPLLPLPRGWSLHTKLALGTSLCLVMAGTTGLLVFETPGRIGYWYAGKGNLLAQQDAVQPSPDWMRSHRGAQRLGDAIFQAAVAPASGLRTVPVDPGAMSPASEFLLLLLMLVGGAPASTAGGLKTVAVAVLVLHAVSLLRGRRRAEAFGRQIPAATIRRVLALVFGAAGWLVLTILVLVHIERANFLPVVFEAASAFSGSGLSLGITPTLTALGKGIIILTMLVGQMGPLALMIYLAAREQTDPAELASSREQVVLG